MNYEIGDKFIFEIDRIYSSKKHSESRYGIKGFENFVLSKRKLNELQTHKNIERLEEHDIAVSEKAFQHGYETKSEWFQNDAYRRGLQAAWDLFMRFGNMSEDERSDCFGTVVYMSLLYVYSPQEAIDRLKAYEEQKAKDAEIHLGDEVEAWDTNDWVRFIAWTDECGEVTGIDEFGGHYSYPTSNCRKTGRHFSISFSKEDDS